MTSLQERVIRFVNRESLIPEHGRVLVALSGGSDSVALTLLLHEIASTTNFTVVGVVHLNHQLRQASADDELFCRRLAKSLSLPIEVGRADVRSRAKDEQISLEEAGHLERQTFFKRIACKFRADCVATAHTRNDQAETYLMRLIRGAGPQGLAGIWPRFGKVIRPLLNVSRAELRNYLTCNHQSFREDETNNDVSITRNRIRHELLPFLEERFSPGVIEVIARQSVIARNDSEWLELTAKNIGSTLINYEDEVVGLNAKELCQQPRALASRIVKQALEYVTGRGIHFIHIEQVLNLADADGSKVSKIDLPGCHVERRNGQIRIGAPQSREVHSFSNQGFSYQLAIPGEVNVPEAGLVISAEQVSGTKLNKDKLVARGDTVTISGGHIVPPLVVRSWQPGDIFRPLGLDGHKKIQDLFIDRKVIRSERYTVPIVADTNRGIVWVVGHTVAEDFRVTSSTEGMLVLRARKLGDIR